MNWILCFFFIFTVFWNSMLFFGIWYSGITHLFVDVLEPHIGEYIPIYSVNTTLAHNMMREMPILICVNLFWLIYFLVYNNKLLVFLEILFVFVIFVVLSWYSVLGSILFDKAGLLVFSHDFNYFFIEAYPDYSKFFFGGIFGGLNWPAWKFIIGYSFFISLMITFFLVIFYVFFFIGFNFRFYPNFVNCLKFFLKNYISFYFDFLWRSESYFVRILSILFNAIFFILMKIFSSFINSITYFLCNGFFSCFVRIFFFSLLFVAIYIFIGYDAILNFFYVYIFIMCFKSLLITMNLLFCLFFGFNFGLTLIDLFFFYNNAVILPKSYIKSVYILLYKDDIFLKDTKELQGYIQKVQGVFFFSKEALYLRLIGVDVLVWIS